MWEMFFPFSSYPLRPLAACHYKLQGEFQTLRNRKLKHLSLYGTIITSLHKKENLAQYIFSHMLDFV